MRKNWRNILLVVGILLIVAGIVLMAVIVPSMRVFPNDVDTTRTYDVAYFTALDRNTMQFLQFGPEESANLRIERHVQVLATDGNKTLVAETQTILLRDPATETDTPLTQIIKYHTLDRRTLEPVADFPEAWTTLATLPDANWDAHYWPREGVTIGWGPEGVEQRNYLGWSDDYRDTVDMVFVREEEHGGINTYYFTAASEPRPIDPAHLTVLGLPPALPLSAISALVAGLDIEDEATRATVQEYLPLLLGQVVGADGNVPLTYYYDYTGEYWVEPDTGVIIDTHKIENRTVSFTDEVITGLQAAITAMTAPGNRMFPEDVDTTRVYDVSQLTLLDAATMQFLRFGEGETADLRIERNIKVEEVNEAGQMLVCETQILYNGETVLMQIVKRYALDRRTMEALAEPPEAWTQTEGYAPRQGLVIGWGLNGAAQQDYLGWSDDLRTTVPLVYVGEEEHNGVNTYHFTATGELQPMAAEQVTALGLPAELPMEAIQALAAGLDIEDPTTRMFVTVFLPNLLEQAVMDTQGVTEVTTVPMAYFYEYSGDYWVEPNTGVLIDVTRHERRAVGFPTEIMDHLAASITALNRDPAALNTLLPVTVSEMTYNASEQAITDAIADSQAAAATLSLDPAMIAGFLPVTVNAYEYQGSTDSVAAARDDAQESLDKLNLFGKTIPMILIALGIVAFLVGWYVHFTTPKVAPAPAAPPEQKPAPKKEEPKP